MTTLSNFSEDEQKLLLGAPMAVLKAAIVVDKRPGPIRHFRKMAAGVKMILVSRSDVNPFVQAVALGIVERSGSGKVSKPLPAGEEGGAVALDQAERTLTLLRAKAEGDAEDYGMWLVGIATSVIESGRSGSGALLGGNTAIKPAERSFIDRLTELAQG